MIGIYKFLTKKYNTVSFDIFDTLIERNVNNPTDIFTLAGGEVLGINEAEEFKAARIEAEKKARLKSSDEVTLDDIYALLPEKYLGVSRELKEKEIKIELRECRGIQKMISFAKELITNGKNIILISDMYLPQEIIEEMLHKCGMTYYKHLYVSNVCGSVKCDGSLFKYAIMRETISNKSIIHFGDSIKADYLGARKAGVFAVVTHRKRRLRRMVSR